jgi:hypothetical protein
MDWTSLIGPAVVAAVIASVVSVIGFLINRSTVRSMHTERLAFDREQAERKITADIDLAERRFKYDVGVTEAKIKADLTLAEKKLALDRALAAWKRKTELAEEILAEFYQARDIIGAARSPFGYSHEGLSRQKGENETPEDTRILNLYFAVSERLASKAEFFTAAWARRYQFSAVFGSETARTYDDLFEIRNEIIVTVGSLISAHGHRLSATDQASKEQWENTIWSGSEDDPIPARLNQIIESVEAACRPVIQEVAL